MTKTPLWEASPTPRNASLDQIYQKFELHLEAPRKLERRSRSRNPTTLDKAKAGSFSPVYPPFSSHLYHAMKGSTGCLLRCGKMGPVLRWWCTAGIRKYLYSLNNSRVASHTLLSFTQNYGIITTLPSLSLTEPIILLARVDPIGFDRSLGKIIPTFIPPYANCRRSKASPRYACNWPWGKGWSMGRRKNNGIYSPG